MLETSVSASDSRRVRCELLMRAGLAELSGLEESATRKLATPMSPVLRADVQIGAKYAVGHCDR
jgi:hypothetical protein